MNGELILLNIRFSHCYNVFHHGLNTRLWQDFCGSKLPFVVNSKLNREFIHIKKCMKYNAVLQLDKYFTLIYQGGRQLLSSPIVLAPVFACALIAPISHRTDLF